MKTCIVAIQVEAKAGVKAGISTNPVEADFAVCSLKMQTFSLTG